MKKADIYVWRSKQKWWT